MLHRNLQARVGHLCGQLPPSSSHSPSSENPPLFQSPWPFFSLSPISLGRNERPWRWKMADFCECKGQIMQHKEFCEAAMKGVSDEESLCNRKSLHGNQKEILIQLKKCHTNPIQPKFIVLSGNNVLMHQTNEGWTTCITPFSTTFSLARRSVRS